MKKGNQGPAAEELESITGPGGVSGFRAGDAQGRVARSQLFQGAFAVPKPAWSTSHHISQVSF